MNQMFHRNTTLFHFNHIIVFEVLLLSGCPIYHNAAKCSRLQYIALLFRYGDIDSVRMLPNRHCAFVNYTRPECAAQALKGLQVR